MNDKEIKKITRKSIVKAPHDFTDRLMYRIENEALVRKPVRIPIPYIVMGALAFVGIIAWITLSLPEVTFSGNIFKGHLPKRGFQVAMAIFLLVALQWMNRLLKDLKKIT